MYSEKTVIKIENFTFSLTKITTIVGDAQLIYSLNCINGNAPNLNQALKEKIIAQDNDQLPTENYLPPLSPQIPCPLMVALLFMPREFESHTKTP